MTKKSDESFALNVRKYFITSCYLNSDRPCCTYNRVKDFLTHVEHSSHYPNIHPPRHGVSVTANAVFLLLSQSLVARDSNHDRRKCNARSLPVQLNSIRYFWLTRCIANAFLAVYNSGRILQNRDSVTFGCIFKPIVTLFDIGTSGFVLVNDKIMTIQFCYGCNFCEAAQSSFLLWCESCDIATVHDRTVGGFKWQARICVGKTNSQTVKVLITT